jgi:hypothetical protein
VSFLIACPAAQASPSEPPLTFNGTKKAAWTLDQSAASNRVRQVPDPAGSGHRVLRLTAYGGDVNPLTPTDNPRAQLVGPPNIEPGDEVWESWRMYFPASFPNVAYPKWLGLMTPFYGPPFAGSGPLGFEMRGSRLAMGVNEYALVHWVPVWSVPLVRRRWYRFALHFKFAAPGWVELWVNDKPQLLREANVSAYRLHLSLIDPSNWGGANSARILIYFKRGAFRRVSVYYSAFRMGGERADVNAPAR